LNKFLLIIKLSILICFLSLDLYSQDPNFSQWFNNKQYYNPAFVGLTEGFQMNLNFRKCWPKIPGQFETIITSFDKSLWNITGIGGIGLITYNNVEGAGELSTTTIGIPLSSRIRVTKNWILQFAIMPQYQMRKINWEKLTFPDQLSPYYGKYLQQSPGFQYNSQDNISFFDLSFGMLFSYESFPGKQDKARNKKLTGGFSMHHYPEPGMSFLGMNYPLETKMIFHLDGEFPLSPGYFRRKISYIMPGFIFEKQGPLNSYMFGANFRRWPLTCGIWMRNQDINVRNLTDIILLFGYQLPINHDNSSRITVFYSYDITVSNLTNHNSGSHEIGIRTNFDNFYILKCDNCKDDRRIIFR
jgi:type IX secretion system PorP/SprF family membrane protein